MANTRKYKHSDLVNFAVNWLQSQGFNNVDDEKRCYHAGLVFIQDKEMVWKVHREDKIVDGIHRELNVIYPYIEQKLYISLNRLMIEIRLLQGYLESLMARRVTITEQRAISKKIGKVFGEASGLVNRRYLGPRRIDVVGIESNRKVAIECGNTKYRAEDFPEYFSEVIFIPYPVDGAEPQLVWGRRW